MQTAPPSPGPAGSPVVGPLNLERLDLDGSPRPPASGPGAARPLVLIHGFTGDNRTWSRLLPELARRRPGPIFGLELVGHGRSPIPAEPAAYRMPATLEACLASLDRAGLQDPVDWLGYSMGGRVALSLALAQPERVARLCLVGAAPGLAEPEARAARVAADEALARSIEQTGLEAFVERWMANPLFASQARLGPTHLAAARAQRLDCSPEALAHSLRQLGTGRMPPLWDRLQELRAPTLLVVGSLDAKFGELARRMAARIPDARVVSIPDAGHAVQVEAPRALAEALSGFLAELGD